MCTMMQCNIGDKTRSPDEEAAIRLEKLLNSYSKRLQQRKKKTEENVAMIMSVKSRAENWTWRDDRHATLDSLSWFSDKHAVSIVYIWRFIYLSLTITFLCFCCDKHAYIEGVYPSQTFTVHVLNPTKCHWEHCLISDSLCRQCFVIFAKYVRLLSSMWCKGAKLVLKLQCNLPHKVSSDKKKKVLGK